MVTFPQLKQRGSWSFSFKTDPLTHLKTTSPHCLRLPGPRLARAFGQSCQSPGFLYCPPSPSFWSWTLPPGASSFCFLLLLQQLMLLSLVTCWSFWPLSLLRWGSGFYFSAAQYLAYGSSGGGSGGSNGRKAHVYRARVNTCLLPQRLSGTVLSALHI